MEVLGVTSGKTGRSRRGGGETMKFRKLLRQRRSERKKGLKQKC